VNANSYLAVNSGVISHDAVWPAGIPYYIQNNVSVQGTDGVDGKTTLTIQPGALLLFYQYTSLMIGASSGAPGALIAQGTIENPIWFTSSKTTPAAGDWYGIYFYNTADDSTTIMEYCNVAYGGFNNQGGIYIWDANPTLRYNNIANNKYGIYVYTGNPVITYNNIYNNTGYGLYRATTSIMNAQDNWWGNATGPYHPTANPAGTGNAVSNYVNFTPWLTE
jgi:parallel beta-helix repeat protein